MSTTQPVDSTQAPRAEQPPERPVLATGDQSEINRLVALSHQRRLTEAEGMRLAALGWTPDANLEHAVHVRRRHPDLFSHLRIHPAAVDTYERNRRAAQDAGRDVREPDAETLAALDDAADELRASLAEPVAELKAVNRANRASFRATALTDWPSIVAALADVAGRDRQDRRSQPSSGPRRRRIWTAGDIDKRPPANVPGRARGGAWGEFGPAGASSMSCSSSGGPAPRLAAT